MFWMISLSLANDFDFEPPYLGIERGGHISQSLPNGTAHLTYAPCSYINANVKFANLPKLMIMPGEEAIIPIDMPAGDLDAIQLSFVVGQNFDIKYTLREFDVEQGRWESYSPGIYGMFSGAGVLNGKLETITYLLSDSNPDYPGHGRHYSKPALLGIHIKNNAVGILPLFVVSYKTKMWVKTLEDAAR